MARSVSALLMVAATATAIATAIATASPSHGAHGHVLPDVDVTFRFDGSSSDLAQQFYRRHVNGATAPKLDLTDGALPCALQQAVAAHSLTFAQLPGLLQRAMLWDLGFVDSHGVLAQVYTPCGRGMSDIAVSPSDIPCPTRTCEASSSQRSCTACTGDQLQAVARCAIDGASIKVTETSLAWSTGGNDSVIPVPNVQRHKWTSSSNDDNATADVLAIHTSRSYEDGGDVCHATGDDSMVIPCTTYASVSDPTKWCRPTLSPLVQAWLNATHGSANGDPRVGRETKVVALSSISKEVTSDQVTTLELSAAERDLAQVLDPKFKYDGTSSDLAQQYLRRFLAGDLLEQMHVAADMMPSRVQARLQAAGLKFDDLNGFLQRALLWDSGYAVTGANALVRVYTSPGKTMADIQLSKAEYERVGCITKNCTDALDALSHRSLFCDGDEMNGMALCAMENFKEGNVHLAMWATGGRETTIPLMRVVRHFWTDAGNDYLVYAVHTGPRSEEPEWNKCSATDAFHGAMVIPCRPYAGGAQWKEPEPGMIVNAWLKAVGKDSNQSKFNLLYLVPIIAGTLSLIVLVVCCYRRRRKPKESKNSMQLGDVDQAELLPAFGTHDYHSGSNGSLQLLGSMEFGSATSTVQSFQMDPVLRAHRIPVDQLEFNHTLTKGAFGVISVCRYQHGHVVVKSLLPSMRDEVRHVEVFMSEIQLTASLNHPNIVRFIGVSWTTLEQLGMVLEYLPKGDLRHFLQVNGEMLSWVRDKMPMAVGIARAVHYLHARSLPIIHRDIKSKNMLLTDSFDVKLIDFGVSRNRVEESMTAGVGTPYWAAPEILQGHNYTEKSDIYSFGVFLSELDTCKLPYQGVRAKDGDHELLPALKILHLVSAGELTPSFTPSCPARILNIARQCLQTSADSRPSADELLALLRGDYDQAPSSVGANNGALDAASSTCG